MTSAANTIDSDTLTPINPGTGAIRPLTPAAVTLIGNAGNADNDHPANGSAVVPAPAAAPTDPVIYDSYTGASVTATGGTPRSFMGGAGTFPTTGASVDVTAVQLFLLSTTATAYTDLQANIRLWDAYDGTVSPVYSSNPQQYNVDFGAFTVAANTAYQLTPAVFPTPAHFSSTSNKGFVVNFQGNTGSGLASTDALTSALAYGAAMATGTNAVYSGNAFYRNVTGRTDFNFDSSDIRNIPPNTDLRLAIILYGKINYSIGGTISGASGNVGLTLTAANPNNTQTTSFATGPFTFSTQLPGGSNWSVTVSTPPAGQTCSVTDGSGSGIAANITNMSVTCVNNYTVTSAVAGSHGAIMPASQSVAANGTASFTVTPNAGFEVSSVTGDTCTATQQGTSATWTSSTITQPCAVTAVFADYPSQCSGAANYIPTFFDDFPGSVLDPAKWTTNANSGTISVANNGVSLSAPNGQTFPYVTSVGSPILATAAFSVRWIATYTTAKAAGTGSLVLSKGVPANGTDHGTSVADAWEDSVNGYRVEMLTTATNQIYAYQQTPPQVVQHDVEYCWLPSTTEVWVDGVKTATQARGTDVPRPDSLWFGNSVNVANTAWTPFTLYYVEVRALNDRVFANGFD